MDIYVSFISPRQGYECEKRFFRQSLLNERELKQASLVDGLTETFNRRFFDETLTMEWARGVRTSVLLKLIMMDIDCFKRFNDTYGHVEVVLSTLFGSRWGDF